MPPDTTVEPQQTALSGVARVLVHAGKLNARTAEDLARSARERKTGFVSAVVAAGALKPDELAHALSGALALPLLDLNAVDTQKLPRNLLDAKTTAQYQVIVLGKRGNRLFIGAADPTDQEAVERIKFATQLTPEWVIVEYDKLMRQLEAQGQSATEVLESLAGEDFDFDVSDDTTASPEAEISTEVEDAPVVRFLQKMLIDAINARASDLHFEPYEYNYRVRFRIDGELREITQPPIAIKDKLASRIKVISRMDIAEKRVPQDGRMKLKFGSKAIDFRVSTLPTLFGEKVVIRILDPSSARLGIEALGYEKVEKDRLLAAIQRPYGMILVTGPTGSGKTVSLYTCLNILNQPGVNIATVEDPAEINLPGINQVNVNDKAGLTFSAALKAFLRQDPDIIMVGEIRDLETADIAIKAAQTGHLVMSTLHTNDAPTTLTRLLNMGVAPFNIAASVLLITAQRLARRLCEVCKKPADYPREALLKAGYTDADLDGSWKPYRAVGCSACNNGYKGRVGIYQVMPITEAIQRVILSEGTALDIAEQAQREGVRDLRQSGLVKVRLGVTSLEEVITVTNE
ncbi:type IV-A pilus assembly ATPase PilB [Rubrivivax benzoatilyticus]|uniref:Type IV-A pilus assembly ATPase PilB n=1 Tax=Rubrivivax benzoatilyticus TaxID=316997 RepID=A0ABX0HVH0_9BURK|nr:type IV-A pilus assembly ATPase PilB [Rubrivivax benzoatilyticus]EGJ10965.1 type IV-A pilus assembly ATPase PilB [Rubrivivax benzoatilyticus JA2 = ATCC BAA-35]NHK97812.1 type IV-A pilus assembly ATPase PilB [Rubrivivax benzoatilyticus]NHL23314.1 type IV-A pilus assembly ATPase PilB [Rubrivivax benzoatilyticus]